MPKEFTVEIEAKIDKTDKEIVELLADGYTVIEISQTKKINRRTLEARIGKLKIQFGSMNVTNLVAYFLRNGLIE